MVGNNELIQEYYQREVKNLLEVLMGIQVALTITEISWKISILKSRVSNIVRIEEEKKIIRKFSSEVYQKPFS